MGQVAKRAPSPTEKAEDEGNRAEERMRLENLASLGTFPFGQQSFAPVSFSTEASC